MKRARLVFWCVVVLLCLSILSNLPRDRYTKVVNGSDMLAGTGIVEGESRVIEEGSGAAAGLFTTTDKIPLQKGRYRVIFRYTTMTEGNTAALVSPGSVNPDNTLGVTYQTAALSYPGYGEVTFELTLDKDIPDLQVQGIYGGDNAFMVHSVSIMSSSLFYTDTLFIVLAILLFALWCDRAFLKKPLALGEAVQDRFWRFAPVLLVVGLGLLTSYPLFNDVLTDGHDISFHLTRMEGLTNALLDGQFPPRIDPTTLNYRGYATSLMYQNLFLWPVALLRILGLSYVGAYKLVYLLCNFASPALAYLAGSRILRSRFAGAVTSVLYAFAQYRLFSIYVRNAQGEVIAMAVFPLFVCGLYEVYFGERKKWPLLAAGVTCLIQSHLVTTYITGAFCALFFLVFLPYLLRHRDRAPALGKAVGVTVLLNLWFMVPLLTMMGEDIRVAANTSGLYTRALPVTELFYDVAHAWFSPGAMLYFAAAALLAVLLLFRGNEATARARRIGAACLSFGALFTFLATTLAPWYALNFVPGVTYAITKLEFPHRFFAVCSIFLALCGGVLALLVPAKKPPVKLGVVMLLTAACFFATSDLMNEGPAAEEVALRTDPPLLHTWYDYQIHDGKYLYNGADAEALIHMNQVASDGDLTVSGLAQAGTRLRFDYTAEGASYIDLPLLYYPGYRITDGDGNKLAYTISPDTLIRLENPPESGHIQTQYTGLWWWRVADGVSLATLLGGAGWALWNRRKTRAPHSQGGPA